MYTLSVYVPKTHLEHLKEALFKAGAGKIGHYSHCAWQTEGERQFMPLEGSNAFLGEINALEKVIEYKVEMTCDAQSIHTVISALKKAHPYETPAYAVTRCEDF